MARVMTSSEPHRYNWGRSKKDISPLSLFFIIFSLVWLLLIAHRWYLHQYSFSYGLDYFDSDFKTYWMHLLWLQLGAVAVLVPLTCGYLWLTRDKEIRQIDPQEELRRYKLAFIYICFLIPLTIFFILGVESDAAWHQVTIRDTDFTPTHIGFFYFLMPFTSFFYFVGFVWVHTRLPDFYNRLSLPLLIAVLGPLLVLPNLGLNEWGHTFFYAEELFAAPIHWGFVVFGWAFFAYIGFILQCIKRIKVLTQF